MLELYLLLVAMIAAAIVAIEIKDLLAAAVSLGVVGFSLAIVFILLQAPDLAIVQIVVEVLSVVYFAAVIFKTTHEDTTVGARFPREAVFPTVAFFAFAVFFVLVSLYVFRDLPPFGQPLMKIANYYIANGLEKTGAANDVAAIILDFRGYDTLGEAVVLFTSVVGVLAIVRKVGRKQ